jgi:hypothetical protein
MAAQTPDPRYRSPAASHALLSHHPSSARARAVVAVVVAAAAAPAPPVAGGSLVWHRGGTRENLENAGTGFLGTPGGPGHVCRSPPQPISAPHCLGVRGVLGVVDFLI